ncbi:MAG: serine/threonine protein kinase, partial [Gemmatimonadota bacterium]|nr:serine/threonine protein kinase [Gemmatimonadota bacterium]
MLEAWQVSTLQPACKGPPLPERYLGRTLGKYRVTRLIGAGAFAWVYEAVDLDLEIPVALKILRPEYAGVPDAETRFRREATTAARLRHPNIVTIRDVGQIEGASFVAMDLLPLSLARRLEVLQRLPEAEVVRMALDVAAALSIAHADGVVHRDIKPDNVLLGLNGESVVADFGLADAITGARDKPTPLLSNPNQVMGTPHYFSPEQARGLDLDGRADLYALGVTCYRAATGRLPFEGDDWYGVARQHIEAEVVPLRNLVPELSAAFEAIVMRLLAKSPDERFATGTQLVDALLMLPTAPVSRALSLVPVTGAAVTQISSPYFGVEVLPKNTLRRNLVAGGVVAAIAAVALIIALPSVANRNLQSFLHDTAPPSLPVRLDSSLIATPITVANATDGMKSIDVPAAIVTHKAGTTGKKPPVPLTARVQISAPESADLFVGDKFLAAGQWSGELPVGKTHLRALLKGGAAACWSAQRDTTITLGAGQPNEIYLDVATCSILVLNVTPDDAEFTISSEDFSSTPKKARSAGLAMPFVLR